MGRKCVFPRRFGKKGCKNGQKMVFFELTIHRLIFMAKNENQGMESPVNLSDLADFQFGPAWTRGGDTKSSDFTRFREPREAREPRDREHRAPRRPADGERKPFNTERRGPRPQRDGRPPRRDGAPRPPRELPQPAEGFRVELRPANSILEIFSKEIQKQKRALPLLDLARVVMAERSRYDLVFMKLENGPQLIHSTKGDGACWLTEQEAVAYLWKAPWFAELYTVKQEETEAPKGNFTSVARIGEDIIGPGSWHGYQAAMMNLYRSKYSTMPLEVFRNKITQDTAEEAVAAWLAGATHKNVWVPAREGAEETVLADTQAVEADFRANHYASVYEVVDKVFINADTPRAVLSPGLAAHIAIMGTKTRQSPQMLIPNLCHGMARYHLPIYKWHGHHYTGPSRIRAIAEGTVLADRMMAIVNWSKENSGKKADVMFAELSGVPAGTDEESSKAAQEAHAPYVADMIWLLEQGYIVVTGDNAVWYPKGDAAPEPTKDPRRQGNRRRPQGKPAPKAKKPAAEPPAAPAGEQPAAAPEA